MIYLQNITDAQVLYIPKSGDPTGGELILAARNTTDLDVRFDQVVDLDTSDLYFNLAVSLPGGLPDGEYEYALMDDGVSVSNGILILESAYMVKEYEKEITYEQYTAN